MASYHLMNGDTRVMAFERQATDVGDTYIILSVERPELLPPVFRRADNMGFAMTDWVQRRTIPVNRHHMEAVLGAINMDDRFDILCYCHGLSLNDTYWIQSGDENLRARFNLASFDIRYDFLKTCPFRRELASKARTLVTAIGDGSLKKECVDAVNGFERYETRVEPTLSFVEQRCQEFIE